MDINQLTPAPLGTHKTCLSPSHVPRFCVYPQTAGLPYAQHLVVVGNNHGRPLSDRASERDQADVLRLVRYDPDGDGYRLMPTRGSALWRGWLAESCVSCGGDRLAAVVDVQFGEDVGDVVADGSFAEEELGGDLVVSTATSDQLEYLVFAVGELGKRLAGCSAEAWWYAVDEVEESLRGAWTEDGLSASDAVNDPGDLVVVVVFEEVAVGAGADGGVDKLVFVEHAEDDHTDVRVAVVIWRVASTPSSTGMRRSMTTTSGWSESARSTACWPSAARPMTSKPPMSSSSRARPSR